MRHLFFIIVFIAVSLPSHADEMIEVSVDVSTKNKAENAVREEAKLKAIDKAIERLPQLISGRELLRDDVLIEEIKAVSYSYVDIDVLSERWDSKGNMYYLDAKVNVDSERSFGLLMKLKENEARFKALMGAYSALQQSIHEKMDGYDYLEAFSDYRRLKLESIVTPDLKLLEKGIEEREQIFVQKHNELLAYIASTITIALKDVDVKSKTSTYSVTGINPYNELQKLLAFLGDGEVNHGELLDICGFSNGGWHFSYSPTLPSPKKRSNIYAAKKQLSQNHVTREGEDSIYFEFTFEHFNIQELLESVESTFAARVCA